MKKENGKLTGNRIAINKQTARKKRRQLALILGEPDKGNRVNQN